MKKTVNVANPNSTQGPTNEQNPEDFDKQLEKLRSVVEQMEHGGLTLDDSLKLFEEGINLSKRLFFILNESEGKVEELLSNMERVPFQTREE